jgi:polyribonucleotide nucleotidyltransferase
MYNLISKTFDIGDGRTITIETGKLAKQADGSVIVKMGNTVLLATVCSRSEAAENVDFMPLTVDYQERYASAGRWPGGFFRREARPSDYEVLISRLIDRALRPLFPDDYHADTQVLVYLMSHDEEILPDSLAALAASAALAVSDVPFNGPISEVRVGRVNGKLILNPGKKQLEQSDIDIIVAANEKDINMMEGQMKEVSEADMLEALKFAHEHIKIQVKAQKELAAMVGKAKREYSHENNDEDLRAAILKFSYDKCYAISAEGNPNKKIRSEKFKAVKEEFIATLTPEEALEKKFLISKYYHDVEKKAMRDCVLNTRKRLDSRGLEDIRPIWTEVDYLPSTHGSAVFTRGETQALTTVTLGTKLDEQIIDGVVFEGTSRFLLHYNFPPFSTGETKFMRGTSRREVGHGNLALRALKMAVPEDFPYAIRIVSDVLESNGSSSMATVCASSLALHDAGVAIKEHVSGIAMGLIADGGKYAVLSDILGDEDHLGDMDFKVCGTSKGITACQMDIKVDGLSYSVLEEAMAQAKKGREHILAKLNEAISKPRAEYKPFVPRIVTLEISTEFIGAVIGPGGKHIQELQKETGTTISIEERDNKGFVEIAGANAEGVAAAVARVKGITQAPEIGSVYTGTVKKLMAFGAFVEFLPKKEGLLHISEYDWKKTEDIADVLKEGDKVEIKLLEIDPKTGKFRLSRKALLPKPEGMGDKKPAKDSAPATE